ncbi:MAG: DNA polymerase III subunit delta' [Acidobacteria bacterium]|nr:DNA polymerase III subunit delta' [Acidobacteriota bacterium]
MKLLHYYQFLGNEKIIDLAKRSLSSGRFPHSVILSGKDGTGKRTFAEIVTSILFCQSGNEGEACGVCKNCKLLASDTHPDYFMLSVQKDTKSIGIEQVREVIANLHRKPFLSKYKSVVINPADLMTIEAANALLKLLEEPHDDTYLFLVTDKYDSLLPTIRSRTQHFQFSSIPSGLIAKHLQDNLRLSEDEALRISRLSDGSLGEALRLSGEDLVVIEELYNKIENVIIQGDPASAAELVQLIVSEKSQFDNTIKYCYAIFRDINFISWNPEIEILTFEHYRPSLIRMAESIKKERLLKLLGSIEKLSKIKNRNLNIKLNVESLVTEIRSLNI